MAEVPEPGEEQNKLDKVEEWQTEQYVQRIQPNKKSCMSPVRRNAGGFLETEQWKCRSYAAAKRRLCHSSTATCKVVMTQWWLVRKIPMCLCCFWPVPVPLMPVSSRNAVLRYAQGWLTLVKWLLLSGKMFVRLSLVFMPLPDVTQFVLLLVKANSSP